MLRRAAKILAITSCTFMIWVSTAASTQAGAIPNVWNLLFGTSGCHRCGGGGCCGGGYYRGYYGGSFGSYYGPVGYGYGYGGSCCGGGSYLSYGSGCGGCGSCGGGSCGGGSCGGCYSGGCGISSGCGSCGSVCSTYGSPCCAPCSDGCGTGCGSGCGTGCGSSGCGAGCATGITGAAPSPAVTAPPPSAAQPPSPIPNPPKSTYDPNATDPAGRIEHPPTDPNTEKRFVPRQPEPPTGATVPQGDDKDSFPSPKPTDNPNPAAAPKAGVGEEDKFQPPAENTTKRFLPVNPAPTDKNIENKAELNVAPLNLGDHIVWGTPVLRSVRREIRPQFANARLVRIPAFPNSDWIPVADSSTIAKK